MLIIVQFPLADLRAFVDADDVRVPISTQFSQQSLINTRDYGGDQPAPFLRRVGELRKRRQGARLAGESLYFSGRRAIVFPAGLRSVPDPRGEPPIPVTLFFRRFQAFQNDHQLARFELALLLDLAGREPLDGPAVKRLLASCLELPVIVHPDVTPGPIAKAGPRLAAGLLRATTYLHRPPPPSWVMCAGTPAMLVEYGSAELNGLPPGATVVAVDQADRIRLAVSGLVFDRVLVSTWFLSTGVDAVVQGWFNSEVTANARDLARQLRINLLRHHAEREVLAYTLDSTVIPDRLTVRGPDLQHAALRAYIVRAAARLTRRERFGFDQAPITNAIFEMEASAELVDRANLSRYGEVWEHLASVLGADLFTQLFDVLQKLPMGSPLEIARLKELLLKDQAPPRKVAVSYAHLDDRLMKSFASHLELAVREGMVTPWDDRWIVAGAEWKTEIDRRFLEADIVVALVSPDFLQSEYCMTVEMPRVIERAARHEVALVGVIVRPCEWEKSLFANRQVVLPHNRPVTQWGNRAEAWNVVIHRILTAGQTPR